MAVARALILIEDIPMPQLAVAAKVELPGAKPADRQADFSQLGPLKNSGRPALKERAHPIRVELFVLRNKAAEMGGLEWTGHDGQRRGEQGQGAGPGDPQKVPPAHRTASAP